MARPRPVPREHPAMVKVRAKNENIAKYIKHLRGSPFTREGTAFWPLDQFTQRRIRDGDVTIVEQEEQKAAKAEGREGREGREGGSARAHGQQRTETTRHEA